MSGTPEFIIKNDRSIVSISYTMNVELVWIFQIISKSCGEKVLIYCLTKKF